MLGRLQTCSIRLFIRFAKVVLSLKLKRIIGITKQAKLDTSLIESLFPPTLKPFNQRVQVLINSSTAAPTVGPLSSFSCRLRFPNLPRQKDRAARLPPPISPHFPPLLLFLLVSPDLPASVSKPSLCLTDGLSRSRQSLHCLSAAVILSQQERPLQHRRHRANRHGLLVFCNQGSMRGNAAPLSH